jgi:hypothetical protein
LLLPFPKKTMYHSSQLSYLLTPPSWALTSLFHILFGSSVIVQKNSTKLICWVFISFAYSSPKSVPLSLTFFFPFSFLESSWNRLNYNQFYLVFCWIFCKLEV